MMIHCGVIVVEETNVYVNDLNSRGERDETRELLYSTVTVLKGNTNGVQVMLNSVTETLEVKNLILNSLKSELDFVSLPGCIAQRIG